MTKSYKITTTTGVLLAAFCIACRFSTSVADFYALKIYPIVSDILSWLSSPIPFNMEEIAITGIICFALSIIIIGIKHRWGWKQCIKYECLIILWTYVWFYMAWCNNYSRSSIFERTTIEKAKYDKKQFIEFCTTFINEANNSWTEVKEINTPCIEKDIKTQYANVPGLYGLSTPRPWHHPKPIIFNSLYSSVGILGFMAPLFGESLLNRDLQEFDYPFTYAHEYAHMLGVSSEAEANWWAYNMCILSKDKAVRYSAYKNIITHVLYNARLALTAEEYEELLDKVDKRIIKDIKETREHWTSKRSLVLRNIHEWTFDTFLKSNNISSGVENYSEVVGMLIQLPQVNQMH